MYSILENFRQITKYNRHFTIFFSNFRHHQKSSYARIISSLPLHGLYGLHNLGFCPSVACWVFGEFCGKWREWRRRRRRNFTAALSTKYTVWLFCNFYLKFFENVFRVWCLTNPFVTKLLFVVRRNNYLIQISKRNFCLFTFWCFFIRQKFQLKSKYTLTCQ